jgi:acetyl-CoA/propionyl-CoA carboxylase biotin carboxyl carrier protein
MLRALDEFVIDGPTTLIGFHKALLSHECFVRGETCHGLVESEEIAARAAELQPAASGTLPLAARREIARTRAVEVDGRRFEVRVLEPEPAWRDLARRRSERARAAGAGAGGAIVSPMQGTVLSVAVAEGDAVEAGQLICIVEAMKMENEVHAALAGTVADLSVQAGQPIATGQVICRLEA